MSNYGRHGDLDFSGHPIFADPPTEQLAAGEPTTDEFEETPYPDAADHLDDDPFKDDLSAQLAAREPRRWANRATAILAGVVLVIGGFVAGAQVEKHFGHLSAAGTPSTFPSGFAGFGGGTGGTGGTGTGGGNATTGTVKFVDGTTVYITTADGGVVTVKTDGSTAVQVSQPGSLKDLPVGSSVTVTGQTGSDGTVSATKITRTK